MIFGSDRLICILPERHILCPTHREIFRLSNELAEEVARIGSWIPLVVKKPTCGIFNGNTENTQISKTLTSKLITLTR